MATTKKSDNTKVTKEKKPPTFSELVTLTDKADPKPEHLALMRKHLDGEGGAEIVKLNEVGERAIKAVIDSYADSALLKEMYYRQIAAKRSELGYEAAEMIERLLIDQVVLCHLRVSMMEMTHANKIRQSHSIDSGLYWDKMLTGHHRRFERAMGSLAKVRKLLAETRTYEERANNARQSATKKSLSILKMMTDN